MPELPEVETTRRGLAPHVLGQTVRAVAVRQPRLRWPVSPALARDLPGQTLHTLARRGKYLLFGFDRGTLIVHLGMSGSLRVTEARAAPGKFDHVDIAFAHGLCLRLRDPRRFGAVLWTDDPARHPLLAHLGPEPLAGDFDAACLFARTRKRTRAIRDLLLDGRIVAGVGNIYANEALFAAGIRPTRAAGRLTRADCARLVRTVRATLTRAIRAGGTTLRDFRGGTDEPGYFQLRLKVYGRAGAPCLRCAAPGRAGAAGAGRARAARMSVRAVRLGQRSAFYCPRCQT